MGGASFFICTVLIACGGASTGHTPNGVNSPGTPDACTVLTQTAAANITGDSAMARIGGGETTSSNTCVYSNPSGAGGGGATMTIEPVPAGVASQALQAALAQAMPDAGGQAQPVSGIGDRAVKVVASKAAGVAFVKRTDLVILGVSSGTRSGADLEPDLEALAKEAAGRISG